MLGDYFDVLKMVLMYYCPVPALLALGIQDCIAVRPVLQ